MISLYKSIAWISAENGSFLIQTLTNSVWERVAQEGIGLIISILACAGLYFMLRTKEKRLADVEDAHKVELASIRKQQFQDALEYQKTTQEFTSVIRELERTMRENQLRTAEKDNHMLLILEQMTNKLGTK